MKLVRLSLLLNRSSMHQKHKSYAFFVTLVLCLEYLDIIVYLRSAHILTGVYLHNSIHWIYILLFLFIILWLTNLIAKAIVKKLLRYLQPRWSNSQLVISASFIITISFILQAIVIYFYCNTLISHFLLGFFVARLIYQIALGVVIHDIYEFLLDIPELCDEVIYLILNSLELSVLISVLGYKALFFIEANYDRVIMLCFLSMAILWLFVAVMFTLNRHTLKQMSNEKISCQAAHNFSIMLKTELKDTIIAFSVVGVRSSLCIVGVIYMPIYLISGLHFMPHYAENIIAMSSLSAFALNVIVDRYLHNFAYMKILKSWLVGLIIGSLISYLLFFFHVIPFIGVAILVMFHSLFALVCPFILNDLFTPKLRQVAIVACYRNSFLIFASFTFILLSLFIEILHNYVVTPALLLIAITAICYVCLVLFNKQSETVNELVE